MSDGSRAYASRLGLRAPETQVRGVGRCAVGQLADMRRKSLCPHVSRRNGTFGAHKKKRAEARFRKAPQREIWPHTREGHAAKGPLEVIYPGGASA